MSTIKLSNKTKKRLENLKEKRQTYEDVIVNILDGLSSNTNHRIYTCRFSHPESLFYNSFMEEPC